MDDRACLNGILFVLATGIGWERLPQQLGYGSGMTCWRRLRDWQAAGVWHRLHALLLAELRAAGRLELTRAIADSARNLRKPVAAAPLFPYCSAVSPGLRNWSRHPAQRLQLSWLNMSLPLAVVSGTCWSTSQCSIILPSSLNRQMSTPAMFKVL